MQHNAKMELANLLVTVHQGREASFQENANRVYSPYSGKMEPVGGYAKTHRDVMNEMGVDADTQRLVGPMLIWSGEAVEWAVSYLKAHYSENV